jgi:RHS repeat-associated protein
MQMPGRIHCTPRYRYGFNGKEKDDEVKGVGGTQYDYGFRIYDPRIGKFLSVDPLTKDYAMLTPFQFASNCPISGIDLDGLEYYYAADGTLIAPIWRKNGAKPLAGFLCLSWHKKALLNPTLHSCAKDCLYWFATLLALLAQ